MTVTKTSKNNLLTFQDIISQLQHFWADQGCIIEQPYSIEMGAGTFHPSTDQNHGVQPSYNLLADPLTDAMERTPIAYNTIINFRSC